MIFFKVTLAIYSAVCFQPLLAQIHSHSHEEHHETHWSQEKLKALDIRIQPAEGGAIQTTIQATGHILIHPNHLAYIIPKVSGTVKILRKEPGDPVEEDEVLAVLESQEIAEAKSNYLAALKRLGLKKTLLQREEQLQQISPAQDYLQAQLSVAEAEIELELTKQKLNALGLDDLEITQISKRPRQHLRFYEMRAPFKGEVIKRDLTLGEFIDNQHKAYTIADFSLVRASLNIKPSDLPYVKPEQPIEISSNDGAKTSTHVFYIEPILHEESRSAVVLADIDNTSKQWAPGMFINALILKEVHPVSVLVPKEAIQTIQGEEYVFIFDEGHFNPRLIKTGQKDHKNVEVVTGLEQGELYAASHTFLLKADLQKSEAQHSHSH